MRPIRSRPRGFTLSLVVASLCVVGTAAPPTAGAQQLLDPGADYGAGLDITPIGGGGFLAVWNRERLRQLPSEPDACVPDEIVGVELDAFGQPLGPPAVILQATHDDGPPKIAAETRFPFIRQGMLAWRDGGELRAQFLDFDDGFDLGFADRRFFFDCLTDSGHGLRDYDLVRAGGRFWVVWSSACDEPKVQAQRLEPDGFRTGPQVTVSDQAIGAQPGGPIGIVPQFDGGFSVAWIGEIPGGGRGVVARRFGPDGSPLTDAVQVSPGPVTTEDSLAAGGGPVSAVAGIAVAWRDGDRLFLRQLWDTMTPVGPPLEVATVSEPGDIHLELVHRNAATVLSWRQGEAGSSPVSCPAAHVRSFSDTRTDAALPLACLQPEVLASETFHALVAGWLVEGVATGPLCTRPAAGLLLTPDDLPPGPAITDPELPDFRFHVRIGGDEPNPRTGRAEPLCLPETVCVSGALEGRTEVLLRVVGPRPNGRLWPTIVRFTTSQVEVWIEQLSTGEVEYYLLAGSSPGSEELDGLFDREGFPPG